MTDQNKSIVNRFIQEFKNKANHAVVDELMANDFKHHFKDPRLPPGRDAMKVLGIAISKGFPDVQVTVEDLLADSDRVIERTTAKGTHMGEFQRCATYRQISPMDRNPYLQGTKRKDF